MNSAFGLDSNLSFINQTPVRLRGLNPEPLNVEPEQLLATYPYHFHEGSQENAIESSQFEKDVEDGFRGFMRWVRSKLSSFENAK